MSDDYLWDRSGSADLEIEKLEQLLAPLAHDAPLAARRARRSRAVWLAGAGIALAAGIVLYLALGRHGAGDDGCTGGSGMAFEGQGGDVTCGEAQVASGVLPVGGRLATGEHGARLAIANIGVADLARDTEVRLERTDARRHQLVLERGQLHARVDAPPRLFAVATRTTTVVDLGCEYTIAVDRQGAGSVDVQRGKVELETARGQVVVAPAGTRAAILAGQRPGLPVRHGASDALVAAVAAYERGTRDAYTAVLDAAAPADAITVVALAAIDDDHRARIVARLAELAPPPASLDDAVRDPAVLASWRDDIVKRYFGSSTKKR